MGTVPNPKSNWVAGTVPTANEFNSNIRDAINFFLSPPRAIARDTHAGSGNPIVRSTPTAWSLIPWNTTVAETDGASMHDPSTTASSAKLVAQTAGLYHVWASINWEDHTIFPFDGDRGLQIRKNSGGSASGGTLIAIDHRHCKTSAVGAHGASQQGCDGYVSLAVNDYVESFAFDDDNDTVGGNPSGCYLWPGTWNAARFGMVWIAQ